MIVIVENWYNVIRKFCSNSITIIGISYQNDLVNSLKNQLKFVKRAVWQLFWDNLQNVVNGVAKIVQNEEIYFIREHYFL